MTFSRTCYLGVWGTCQYRPPDGRARCAICTICKCGSPHLRRHWPAARQNSIPRFRSSFHCRSGGDGL